MKVAVQATRLVDDRGWGGEFFSSHDWGGTEKYVPLQVTRLALVTSGSVEKVAFSKSRV